MHIYNPVVSWGGGWEEGRGGREEGRERGGKKGKWEESLMEKFKGGS